MDHRTPVRLRPARPPYATALIVRFDPLVVVRDLRSGAVAWTAEAGGVLGVGDGWLLAKGDWSSAQTVRMYTLGG